MKKIIVILENQAVGPSRELLARLGVSSVTLIPVREECGEVVLPDGGGVRPVAPCDSYTISPARRRSRQVPSGEECEDPEPIPPAEFRPKAMLVLVVADEEAGLVVRSLIRLNEEILLETGRIFICPLISALG